MSEDITASAQSGTGFGNGKNPVEASSSGGKRGIENQIPGLATFSLDVTASEISCFRLADNVDGPTSDVAALFGNAATLFGDVGALFGNVAVLLTNVAALFGNVLALFVNASDESFFANSCRTTT